MSAPRAEPYHIEDESYFVSMTDLMVGMLFVFIIMLMAFALNLKDQQEQVDAATERLTKANIARAELLKQLQEALQREGVSVLIDLQNGVLRLPEKLLFGPGEYLVDGEGRRALSALATHLAALLPQYACSSGESRAECPPETAARLETIFIEGHTDQIPIGGKLTARIADNWELSARRAIEVYRQLIRVRPELDRFETDRNLTAGKSEKLLGVSGYAERRPVAEGNTSEARANNRRIDLRFIMATPDPEEARKFKERFGTGAQQ